MVSSLKVLSSAATQLEFNCGGAKSRLVAMLRLKVSKANRNLSIASDAMRTDKTDLHERACF